MSNRRPGKIFVISGPSGSGKSTLLKAVQAKKEFLGNLVKIVTVTTRSPRKMEAPGRDYRFVSQGQFLKMRQKGAFAEYQEVFGQYYGTPKKDLLRLINSGKDALLCIDVKGALALRGIFPKEVVLIFISVADMRSLRRRLSLRSTESRESLNTRLKIAKEELNCRKHYDYVIINDVLIRAVNNLAAVITAERLRMSSMGALARQSTRT